MTMSEDHILAALVEAERLGRGYTDAHGRHVIEIPVDRLRTIISGVKVTAQAGGAVTGCVITTPGTYSIAKTGWRPIETAAIAWFEAGDRLTATKGDRLPAKKAFSEAGIKLRAAIKSALPEPPQGNNRRSTIDAPIPNEIHDAANNLAATIMARSSRVSYSALHSDIMGEIIKLMTEIARLRTVVVDLQDEASEAINPFFVN